MVIEPLAALNDNYIWLMRQVHSSLAIVVDPGDSNIVLQALTAQHLTLAALFATHHHSDHTAGIAALLKAFPHVPVFGHPDNPHVTHPIEDATSFLPFSTAPSFTVLWIPGHTLDHCAFYSASLNAVFTGDTLFRLGCGRLFEGTYENMVNSIKKIVSLPDDTLLYCGHEYTLSNLAFTLATQPNDINLKKQAQLLLNLWQNVRCTLPSSIGYEKRWNVFVKAVMQNHDERAFQALRDAKDGFKPSNELTF